MANLRYKFMVLRNPVRGRLWQIEVRYLCISQYVTWRLLGSALFDHLLSDTSKRVSRQEDADGSTSQFAASQGVV